VSQISEVSVRIGQSSAEDSRLAVDEFYEAVQQRDCALVIFFCSSRYDRTALAEALNRRFAGVPVVGCTTAGEIGPGGYLAGSLCGFSLPSRTFQVATGLLGDLKSFGMSRGQAFAKSLLRALEGEAPDAAADSCFAFLMIDGLSVREEVVAGAVQAELGRILMFGGSAGDDLKFEQTWVFHDGAFHSDAALLTLVHTTLPFHIFKTQHFVCENERLVVTEADPAHRIVREINGLPAAQEYARIIGTDVVHLNPTQFASSPVVVLIDGTDYVRSIQKLNPDGSLTFYSAIEEGIVFRIARGQNLVDNLRHTLEDASAAVGDPQLVIACDCILRNLEVANRGEKEAVGDLFKRYHAVGFSTYGEQFGGVHVNQTLTGIAIGR
jgi:hypothetical protein